MKDQDYFDPRFVKFSVFLERICYKEDVSKMINLQFRLVRARYFIWLPIVIVEGSVVAITADLSVAASYVDQSANTGKATRTARPSISHHNQWGYAKRLAPPNLPF